MIFAVDGSCGSAVESGVAEEKEWSRYYYFPRAKGGEEEEW